MDRDFSKTKNIVYLLNLYKLNYSFLLLSITKFFLFVNKDTIVLIGTKDTFLLHSLII